MCVTAVLTHLRANAQPSDVFLPAAVILEPENVPTPARSLHGRDMAWRVTLLTQDLYEQDINLDYVETVRLKPDFSD